LIKRLFSVGSFEFSLGGGGRATVLLLAIGLPGLLLAAKTAEIAVAATVGESFKPPALLKALALDPANPDLHYRLGLSYCNSLEDFHPTEGLQQLHHAIALNHRQPVYWSGLASACQALGDKSCADRAIQRALELSPMAPHYYWEAANHYLLEGQADTALAQFRKLIELDPSYAAQTFRLSLSMLDNPQEVYQRVLAGQMNPGLNLAYISFLTAHGKGSDAYPIWKETLAGNRPFILSSAATYIDWLIQYGQDHEALEAWHALEQRGIVKSPPGDVPGSLVFNGSFEQDPLNTGLDWRIRKVPYTWVEVDNSGAYLGQNCLEVDFTVSRNDEYEPVTESVPVAPDHTYLLEAYVRSDSISSDTGPRLRVVDPACASCLDASTEGTVGTTNWHQVSLSFSTSPTTYWVRLSVWRPRSRSFPTDITGTFWLDAVTLKSADSGGKKGLAASPRPS
jgi:hypothetical protein